MGFFLLSSLLFFSHCFSLLFSSLSLSLSLFLSLSLSAPSIVARPEIYFFTNNLPQKISCCYFFKSNFCRLSLNPLVPGRQNPKIRQTDIGHHLQSWAFSVFFNLFNNKKWFFCIFYKTMRWSDQSWALSVFFNFFTNKKWVFAFFIKLIWMGVSFLNRTGAEIGY